MDNNKILLFAGAIIFFFGISWNADAQTPSVVSFTASPTSANSGTPISFSWDLQDAGGYSFVIPCSDGIEIQRSTGSTFACDTPLTSTTATDDFVTLKIHNVSGGTKSITARIIPKDATGQDATGAQQSISISIATLSNPITSFTTSTTTASIRNPVTLSWKSQIIDGVNISIECRSEIHATSTTYAPDGFMPCGTPIFTNDLSPNSSITLNFSNTSQNPLSYRITLLPAITPGTYDGTHTETIDLTILSNTLPEPTVNSFTVSASTIDSGEPVTLSWTTTNAPGVNILMSCITDITATTSTDTTLPLPCGELAFSNAKSADGSLTLGFENKNPIRREITISLVPERFAGGFDTTLKKERTITVSPVIKPLPQPEQAPPPPEPTVPDPEPDEKPKVEPPPVAPQPAPTPKPPPQPTPAPTPAPLKPPPPQNPDEQKSIEEKRQEAPASTLSDEPLITIPPRIETVEKRLEKKLIENETLSYVREITPTTTDEEDKQIYEVVGRKQVNLFFLIPLYMEIRIEASESGEILKIKKPWWSFLAW